MNVVQIEDNLQKMIKDFLGKISAQLYDPEKMIVGLREAQHSLNLTVDSKPFAFDTKLLEYLLKFYKK